MQLTELTLSLLILKVRIFDVAVSVNAKLPCVVWG